MRRFLVIASLLLLLSPAQAQAIPDAPTISGSFCGQTDGFWWTGTGGFTVYRSTYTNGNWTEWQGIAQPESGPFYGAWYGTATEGPRRYSVTASDPTGESDKAAPIYCGQSTTLYVDQNNTNCSNTGPGTQSVPFCMIAPAAARTQPGTTVLVSAGTYVEQVNPHSGAPGDPVTFEAVPGDTVTVTGETNAFWLDEVSWVTIRGFNVNQTTGNGIHAKESSNVQLIGNTVSEAGQPVAGQYGRGMRLELTDSLVANNTVHHNTYYGIYVVAGARNQIVENVIYSNAAQFERHASGIRLFDADDNTVASNVTHHNEDSGIEVDGGSTNNLVLNNVAHDNGDHGIDVLGSTGQRIVSNSVYKNVTAGINAEGSSTGTTLANNISVDNGINSPRTKGNIRVDSASTAGTSIDYDLLRITAGGVLIDWAGTFYSSLTTFRSATGQELHGINADPLWVNRAAGDFRLLPNSPAIDSANSGASGQSATDIVGNPRADDFTVPNTGAGPRLYDDRGAYEFQPPDDPPNAQLGVSPDSGPIDLDVTADASDSTDIDATPIESYTFDFGDGSPVVGPQAGATADHTYTTPGTYTVTVTVTDTAGQSSTATASVTVRDDPPAARLSVTPSSGEVPLPVTADASTSTDTDATPIASYIFDFGDGSPVVGPQAEATTDHIYTTPGTYTVTVWVMDTAHQTSTATKSVSVFPLGDAPPDAQLTVTPDSGTIDLPVTADASASTDNDAIVSYTFNFGDGSPAIGPQAGATADHTYTTPGTYTVTVTVTDTANLSSTATQSVTVSDDPPNATLVVQPGSGPVPLGVSADASGSTDTDATPISSYTFNFGDGSVVGPQTQATATHTYAVAGTYTVTVSVADTAGRVGTATAQVIARANLVSNPGFETNLTGWNTSGSGAGITLARIAGGHTGGWQAQLTNTSTSSSTCLLNDSPDWVTTTSAGPYTAELWVRGETAGASVKLRLREWVGSTLAGTATAQVNLTTSWQRLTVTYTPASPGSSKLDYNAYVTLAAPGTCFYADDASIYRP